MIQCLVVLSCYYLLQDEFLPRKFPFNCYRFPIPSISLRAKLNCTTKLRTSLRVSFLYTYIILLFLLFLSDCRKSCNEFCKIALAVFLVMLRALLPQGLNDCDWIIMIDCSSSPFSLCRRFHPASPLSLSQGRRPIIYLFSS